MKKLLSLVLALCMMMTSSVSLAASLYSGGSTSSSSGSLSSVTPFKFEHKKKGINRGKCPVYSAPYSGAYRANNGKAEVATNSALDIGGYSEDGWLLVRYTTNSGSTRVGWIPPQYAKNAKTSMVPHFSYVKQVAAKSIKVTDDCLAPNNPNGFFAVLDPGETYYVVGLYNYYSYGLWYIEFYIGNQVARGFIPAE